MTRMQLIQGNRLIREIDQLTRMIDKESCGPSRGEYIEAAAKDPAIVAAVKAKIEALKAEFEAL